MADRTSSSITIKAGRDEIMAVIADLESYPEWTDGIRDVEVLGTGPDGRPAKARLTIDAGPIKDTYALAYTWEDDGVRWELVEKGAMVSALHGSYRLAEAEDGTEVTYELAVDVRVPMIGMVKRKGEKRIIDSALKGLRRRLER
ncbi:MULTISPECIES: SRPBCC family protein [Thermomonospora]|uniref:Ribosome-associated toxin RatA of RatAB toxin-antitoxin module n=1 Tax=Thermomonospora cellulosilytica TaxID=1411118 RepID=A0A7W3N325_9ACTN|nr:MULTISPECIES: SRPBCC family protein [Thermomonospora]MBA9006651.1 ribosome-associated toxin RatA of RatAB toxin-antitoxin module [Thermomonospora cellulosilytica]